MMNFSKANLSNFSNYSRIEDTNLEIGGLAYFLVYISDYLPYVVLSAMGTVLGIFGNVLIISAVICSKELHSSTNILVFNLALADLTISGFVDSFTVLGVFLGKNYFDERPFLCQFIGAICLVACETSLVNIGFLAVNRYINICYHQHYKKIFSVKKTLIYCLITWMIGVLIDVPNVTGWGGHFYDPKTLNCVWDRLASQSYSIFFPMSSIVIPCIIILICYMRIFLFAYGAKNKVAASGADNTIVAANTQTQITVAPCVKTTTTMSPTDNPARPRLSTHVHHKSSQSDFSRSLRIAKGLFASFMLFTVCWLPYGMIVMTDYADKLPRSAHMFSMEIAHLNSSFNPVLYAVFNPAFQRGYMLVFRMIFRRKPSTSDKSSSAVPSGIKRNFKTATNTGNLSHHHRDSVAAIKTS